MPLDATTALNNMAAYLVTNAKVLRLHSADPGATANANANTTTASDVTVTLVNDGSGNLSVSTVAFTGGAASGACTYCSLWNTGTTVRYGRFTLSGDQTFNAAGQYTVTSLAVTGTAT